jgi:hypothetical protein
VLTTERTSARLRAGRDAPLGVALALLLVIAAFVTTDGSTLGPNTWTEIMLVVAAAAVGGWLLAAGGRGPAWGPAVVLLAFAGLALLTALSVFWSVVPDTSWIEAGRTLGYLACFATAAMLARLLPGHWRSIATSIAVAATAISAWAVLVKVFAWSFDGQPGYGRLLAPFGYWNATGVVAALGLPPAIWAASRRGGPRALVAAATASIALLITVVLLSYSRSAVLAGILGAAVPLALSEVRLRSALSLAVGGAGAAAICGWALGDHALTGNNVAVGSRADAGHAFGLVLILVLALVAAAAFAIERRGERVAMTAAQRRQIGMALVGLLALVPVGGLIALAVSRLGFTGEISHLWHTLTSSTGSVGDTAGRLANAANSRPAYWHQAASVADHHLLAGAGAGGFGVAHLAYSTRNLLGNVADSADIHAHSYVMQTFADFGLIGLAINLGLLVAWGAAVRRPLSRRMTANPSDSLASSANPSDSLTSSANPSDSLTSSAGAELGRERDGLVALLGVVVAYGVSSAIDWTWFYPGVTLPAMVCAGWLAGRGPLNAAVGLRPHARRNLLARPSTILAVTGVLVVSIALAYGVWQPLRSADADGAAIAAEASGQLGTALADGQSAVSDFPVSLTALQDLADFQEAAGQRSQAEATLARATREQPQNPASWLALGGYSMTIHDYQVAANAFLHAVDLVYAYVPYQDDFNEAVAKGQRH